MAASTSQPPLISISMRISNGVCGLLLRHVVVGPDAVAGQLGGVVYSCSSEMNHR
jgi:hypothetical protein